MVQFHVANFRIFFVLKGILFAAKNLSTISFHLLIMMAVGRCSFCLSLRFLLLCYSNRVTNNKKVDFAEFIHAQVRLGEREHRVAMKRVVLPEFCLALFMCALVAMRRPYFKNVTFTPFQSLPEPETRFQP